MTWITGGFARACGGLAAGRRRSAADAGSEIKEAEMPFSSSY
jgi:hypothetical protein